jgi:hypothetical protein
MLPRNNKEIFRENGWRPSAGWPTQLAQLAFNVSVPSDGLQGAAEKPLHKWLNGSDHWARLRNPTAPPLGRVAALHAAGFEAHGDTKGGSRTAAARARIVSAGPVRSGAQ